MILNTDEAFAIAAPLIRRLDSFPQVDAVLCIGSYASRTQDGRSDLDLYLLCDPEVPSAEARLGLYRSVAEASALEVDYQSPDQAAPWNLNSDRLTIGALSVDLSYNLAAWVEILVQKVAVQGLTSIPEMRFRPFTVLGLLAYGKVVQDRRARVQACRTTLERYPAQLKANLIRENLAVLRDKVEELQDCVARDIGNTAYLFHLWGACDAMQGVLLALNERYDTASKRVEQELGRLAMAPAGLIERWRQMTRGPFDEVGRRKTAELVASLVDEIRLLVAGRPV